MHQGLLRRWWQIGEQPARGVIDHGLRRIDRAVARPGLLDQQGRRGVGEIAGKAKLRDIHAMNTRKNLTALIRERGLQGAQHRITHDLRAQGFACQPGHQEPFAQAIVRAQDREDSGHRHGSRAGCA